MSVTIIGVGETRAVVQTEPCLHCGKKSLVEVDRDKLKRWQAGELIQKVWPEWTADQRELLITGTHSECWEKMFPEEEPA